MPEPELLERLARIEAKLDRIEGRMRRRAPAWWQLPAVIGASVTVFGLGLAAAKALGLL
jgi:hypothetical protein